MNRGSEWRRWDLHVHTASSYDYKYKMNDSDELLVKSWRDNQLSVVAITDHFVIDADRIKKLQSLVTDITILPGVELRCDKGTSNLHVILIFPNNDLDNLSNRFNVIMRDTKAKNKDKNEMIYWDYNDIVEFANDNNGIISIHAGKKDKGIDDGITNSLEVNMAIKAELAETIDIFEMGKVKDIESYNKFVFKTIKRKPMIICSDNHDSRSYVFKEKLWIKADPTFNGLLQAIKEPELRFFVGSTPPKKELINNNKHKFIDKIKIKGVKDSDNWFNQEIPLNYDLVTIIGNKGNGKSALADIIGHAGNTNNKSRFSFLSTERFNQKPEYLGKNYNATLEWANGIEDEKLLYPINNNSTVEKVKYLPQQYIEYVCNDLKDGFNNEIERLIFDYLPQEERLGMHSLNDLMEYLTGNTVKEINYNKIKLNDINGQIIEKQSKIVESEKLILHDKLKDYQKQLEQEIKNKPKEIVKPDVNIKAEEELNRLSIELENFNKELEIKKEELEVLSKKHYFMQSSLEQIEKIKANTEECFKDLNDNLIENGITEQVEYSLDINCEKLKETMKKTEIQIYNIKLQISNDDENEKDGVLVSKIKEINKIRLEMISKLSSAEINYQNYLQDLITWREKNTKISDEISKIREEIRIIENDIPLKLEVLYKERNQISKDIYLLKKEVIGKYAQKYSYINEAISSLDLKESEKPNIDINFYLDNDSMERGLFNHINQNVKSIFRGKEQAKENLNILIETIDINDFENVIDCIERIEENLKNTATDYEKVFLDKNEFFNNLYGLDFIKTSYQLKLGGKLLSKLSPGERGLVLLIFYLLLDKDNCPLIIDQPEDNLDNQSIYDRLVKYIIRAKAQRQIIIVTHNPNIAVACDSEQIIYSNMDKENLEITYRYNSMESPEMKKCIVDVLEGTMPAFEKRSKKYNE